MNNEKILELDNNEMCIVNGESTKVLEEVFGIATSILGLSLYIAGNMENSEL